MSHAVTSNPRVVDSVSCTVARLSQLREAVRRSSAFENDYTQVQTLLECLPLGTSEFELHRRRLENSLRYYHAGEIGASDYELMLVTRGLARHPLANA